MHISEMTYAVKKLIRKRKRSTSSVMLQTRQKKTPVGRDINEHNGGYQPSRIVFEYK